MASLSCCAQNCVMAAPVGLRSMGSGFCDSAALGGRPLPLEGMLCPFVVGAPWPLPLCVLNAFIWLALRHAIHVGAPGLTIEKVCMLVWPAGIGPHVCLVSYPSKCASCLCLAHGPGPVQVFPPPPCHTRATARGEDPKTSLMTNSQGQGLFWVNSQGRDPRTRRGSRPPAAV